MNCRNQISPNLTFFIFCGNIKNPNKINLLGIVLNILKYLKGGIIEMVQPKEIDTAELTKEEIELWPSMYKKRKVARIFSKEGKIRWIEIYDPNWDVTVGLNSISFINLIRHLEGREFEGAGMIEKLEIT